MSYLKSAPFRILRLKQKLLSKLIVYCASLLFLIWVIPETIALRNVLLVIGGLLSVLIFIVNFSKVKLNVLLLTPSFILFLWALIHYLFFSLNKTLEMQELSGLWVRTFFGALFAVGLAISISKSISLRNVLFIAFFSTPIINILAYLYWSYHLGYFILPNEFVRLLFTKVETAYFGTLSAALAFGFIFSEYKKYDSTNFIKLVPYIVGIMISLISASLSDSRTGIALTLMITITTMLLFLKNIFIRKFGNIYLNFAIVTLLVVLVSGWWNVTQPLTQRKWDLNFIADGKEGFDVVNNTQWQFGEGLVLTPINDLGNHSVSSTYYRIAWATVGLKLIGSYPTGYGSINRSFSGLLDYGKIYHENSGQTHSGLIDFGLAFGFPGLIILFATIFFILFIGLKRADVLNCIAISLTIFISGLFIVSELCWKQYFESLIFIYTFCLAIVTFRNLRND